MELGQVKLEYPVSPESDFFHRVFAHRLGEPSLAAYLHQQELVGARGILELPFGSWTGAALQHAKEELKHAEIMHAQATRLRAQCDPSDAPRLNRLSAAVFQATETYMVAVFKMGLRTITRIRSIKGDRIRLSTYYLVSLLIERRIMKIYPYVVHLAADSPFIQASQRIIRDERDHLKQILADVETHLVPLGLRLQPVYAEEQRVYGVFMKTYLDALSEQIS